MNTVQEFEAEQIANLMANKEIPEFGPGDTVRVNVKVIEGARERLQAFEGMCIARSNDGLNSSFTVRKISYGEGVERVFPLYSPNIDAVEVVRRGDVRRAKLYYLRGRRGKSARIAERTDGWAAKLNAADREAALLEKQEAAVAGDMTDEELTEAAGVAPKLTEEAVISEETAVDETLDEADTEPDDKKDD